MSARKRWGRPRSRSLLILRGRCSAAISSSTSPISDAQAEQARHRAGREPAGADGRALPDDLRGDQGAAGRRRGRGDPRRAARPRPPRATAPAPKRPSPTSPRCATSCGRTISCGGQPARRESGFWTFPEINTEATNYYIVVEAHRRRRQGADACRSSTRRTGKTETVSIWGVRVPESVYRAVEADKKDDGIIQHNVVGVKEYGFLDVDYLMPGARRRGDAVVEHEPFRTRRPALARRGAARYPPRGRRDRQAPGALGRTHHQDRESEAELLRQLAQVRLDPAIAGRA